MKFLVLVHYKDSYYALPKDKRAELTSAATDWADKCIMSKKCVEIFMFSNLEGHASIWEGTSAEELARNSMEYPLGDYAHLEIIPVVEWDSIKKMRDAMMAAQKR